MDPCLPGRRQPRRGRDSGGARGPSPRGEQVMSTKPHGPVLTLPVGPRDHAQGPDSAPVTLVEYGDYECPYCGRAYPIVKAIQEELGERLRFVFRNFPLSEMHPNA